MSVRPDTTITYCWDRIPEQYHYLRGRVEAVFRPWEQSAEILVVGALDEEGNFGEMGLPWRVVQQGGVDSEVFMTVALAMYVAKENIRMRGGEVV